MVFWNKKPSDEVVSGPLTAVEKVEDRGIRNAPSHSEPLIYKGLDQNEPAQNPQDSLEKRYGKLRSALGPGTVIQGKLSFDTPVRIDGKLSGEIFSSKALIVGVPGSVEAQLDVQALVIMGHVKGNVRARERIELLAGGSIEGDVQTPALVIEEGASFNGTCTMSQGPANVVSMEVQKASEASARTEAAKSTMPAKKRSGNESEISQPNPENELRTL